ncbi:MAG TPA: adenylate/guanylate cyclase domain-containing protein [Chloroflexia bacterium]|nr:adenylate/guanylate cyclase domain-containing protein [Chloroflexia bacterium]
MRDLVSFLPHYFIQDLLRHPGQAPTEREFRFKAVALFADISGFTPLSERLGAYGISGTEELNAILNNYFGRMLRLVHSYGGCVVKFSGDGLTILFPYSSPLFGPAGADCRDSVNRAVQCALAMQARMPDYQPIQTQAGPFNLTLKAGLAKGPVFCTSAGAADARLEYVVAGKVLERCAEAEELAQPGDTVIDNRLLPYARLSEWSPVNGGFSRVGGLASPVPTLTPLETPPVPAELAGTIASYLHPVIVERYLANQSSFIAEHRRVTTLFVNFETFDYENDRQAGAKLRTYLGKVIETVQAFGGYFRQVEIGDKGSKYLVFFGAPIAHEKDEERALRCALALRRLAATSGIVTRTGIHSGQVFCGLIGSVERQEYSALGDAINLTARLMQKAAPEQILVSESTGQASESEFGWEKLPAVRVKGKSEPVQVWSLLESAREKSRSLKPDAYSLPMVGRAAELQRVKEILGQVRYGQGQVLGITADAGMGKSRLVAEVVRIAREQGFAAYRGECLSYATTSSYLVWQAILADFFGLDAEQSVDEQLDGIRQQLAAINPDYPRRLPLLGAALNLPVSDNPLTQALDPKQRKLLLESLLVDCLVQSANDRPLLLVLEDSHWIDPLSHDLLEAVARQAASSPLLIVLAYRSPELERVKAARVMNFPHSTEIRLKEFTAAEAEHLFSLKLARLWDRRNHATEELSPGLQAEIFERAQGNPFYLDEIINFLHDRGVDPYDPGATRSIEWPDSLQSLILSRIDRLAENEKTILKVASVIGQAFKASWLWEINLSLGNQEQVRSYLDNLIRQDMTRLDKPEPELEYLFRHILTRDVTYNSLALATRATLHEAIGTFIEQNYHDKLEQYLDALAYHYSQTDRLDKQREYYRRAGMAAQAVYANEAAEDYFLRLLPLLGGVEKVEILLKLAKIWEVVGNYTRQEEACREALQLAQADYALLSEVYQQLALVQLHNSSDEAEQTALKGLAILEQAGEGETLKKAAALATLGTVCSMLGNGPKAIPYLQAALDLYRANGAYQREPEMEYALANAMVGSATYTTLQARLEAVLETYQRQENLFGQAEAFNMLGIIHIEQAMPEKATEYYQRELEVCRRIGYKHGELRALFNQGNVCNVQGQLDLALSYYQAALDITLQLGSEREEALVRVGMGALYSGNIGDFEQAELHSKIALAYGKKAGDMSIQGHSLGNLAQVAAQRNELETAEAYLRTALEGLSEIKAYWLMLQVYQIFVFLRLRAGQPEAALKDLEAAESLCHELGIEEGQGLSLQGMRGKILLELGQPEEALKHTGKVLPRMSPGEDGADQILFWHAQALRALGKTAEARAMLEKAYAYLMKRLEGLSPEQRKLSVSNIAENLVIVEAMEKWPASPQTANESLA